MSWNESLVDAITELQDTIGDLTGVAAAPASPVDAPSGQWPISIAFPRAGTFEGGGAAQAVGYHTIVVQLHYSRQELKRAYATIAPYLETIAEAILDDPTIGGEVTTIMGLSYTFGGMTFAGIDTIGWQFDVSVKVRYTEGS